MVQALGKSWWHILSSPGADVIAEEKERTTILRIILALVLAAGLGALAAFQPSQVQFPPGLAFIRSLGLFLGIILAITLALYGAARLLGGRGKLTEHLYITGLLAIPGAVIFGLLARLDIRAILLDLTSFRGAGVIIMLLLIIYGFLLLLLAIDGVHRLGGGKAFRAVVAVIVVGIVLQVGYTLLTGQESGLIQYSQYLFQRRADLLTLTIAHAQIVLFSTAIATALGITVGILITLPPHPVRWWHLIFLVLLALFAFLWFGPGGTLGSQVENWFSESGFLGQLLGRPKAFGLVGMILLIIFYGLFIAGHQAADPTLYTAGILLTVPSIAMFGIFIPIFGIGFFNAAVALILYAQLPILRNTYTGIKAVSPAVIESARGMGLTEWQILYQIKLPLAVPVIMAGIRISVVMIVGIAAIATLIGVEVLGDLIFAGMQRISDRLVFAGALAVSVFAILMDVVLGWGEKILTPAGLRGRETEAA